MTVRNHADEQCVHETDQFDGWDDQYAADPPVIRLRRICPECGHCEEYRLHPDEESDFEQQYRRLQNESDIDHVGLDLVRTDGINAYAHLVVERGEGLGEETVSDDPYYFFC